MQYDHHVGEVRSWLLCPSMVCRLCMVCLGLFALPLSAIGRLCSVIVAIPGFFFTIFEQYKVFIFSTFCSDVVRKNENTKRVIKYR